MKKLVIVGLFLATIPLYGMQQSPDKPNKYKPVLEHYHKINYHNLPKNWDNYSAINSFHMSVRDQLIQKHFPDDYEEIMSDFAYFGAVSNLRDTLFKEKGWSMVSEWQLYRLIMRDIHLIKTCPDTKTSHQFLAGLPWVKDCIASYKNIIQENNISIE